MERILLHKPKMSGYEQDFIAAALADDWAVPLGPDVTALEEELKSFLGDDSKEVVLVNSGTAAMHLALMTLGVKPDDEVLVQSFTFSATANPAVYLGARPVFIDSEMETWNMDPELLEKAIRDRIEKTGKKPAAIIPVALYGMPWRVTEIKAISEKYDIPIVEDAAEALGSLYENRAVGTFGKFGILSFNGNKMITTSGGGAVICPDRESKDKILWYATQARENVPWYLHKEIGYNYRLSNISACIGRGQMMVLDQYINHHKTIHDLYWKFLSAFNTDSQLKVKVHNNPSALFDSNYWLTTITFDRNVDIEALRKRMWDSGIETRHLWKPMHTQPIFEGFPSYTNGVSESLFSRGLCLPSGPHVTEEDVQFVYNNLRSILKTSTKS